VGDWKPFLAMLDLLFISQLLRFFWEKILQFELSSIVFAKS
jgi:hypothetical protein